MAFLKVLIFAAFIGAITAQGIPIGAIGSIGPIHAIHNYEDAPARYQFHYSVNDPNTGDQKAQEEVRDGDAVHGFYTLVEPDGTVRRVDYTADDVNGFQAVVTKNGHAVAAPVQVSRAVVAQPAVHLVQQPAVHVVSQPIATRVLQPTVVSHAPIASIAPAPLLQAPIVSHGPILAPAPIASIASAPIVRSPVVTPLPYLSRTVSARPFF